MKIDSELLEAIHCKETVAGLTHNFYRYPARFSPQFVRAAIKCFTAPGDTVLDPFMGGGTTLVEARALGRTGIGTDISSLAVFVTQAKTTVLSSKDVEEIVSWASGLGDKLNLRNLLSSRDVASDTAYHRNIDGKLTWAIRKTIRHALEQIEQLPKKRQRHFVRCVLLRAAQWALDCRESVPAAGEFRTVLSEFLQQMLVGAEEFARTIKSSELQSHGARPFVVCLHRSAVGLESEPALKACNSPKLIITSPPYAGVHVLYHRWQVLGRKETPAPFWIANCKDGQGASFYTMGDRHRPGLAPYFMQILESFRSLSRICSRETTVVQMVAFSEPAWQLPQYLEAMRGAGFSETKIRNLDSVNDGRVWRQVPNRKWYADLKGPTSASREVVLFHRLSKV